MKHWLRDTAYRWSTERCVSADAIKDRDGVWRQMNVRDWNSVCGSEPGNPKDFPSLTDAKTKLQEAFYDNARDYFVLKLYPRRKNEEDYSTESDRY